MVIRFLFFRYNRKMKNLLFLFCFLACVLLNSASPQCNSKLTCADCMKVSKCAWCNELNFDGYRCFDPSLDHKNECPEEYSYNPDTTVTILENRDIKGDLNEPRPYVRPQRLQLNLRQDDSYELAAKYVSPKRQVDIYYLIDAKSMAIKNRNKIIYLSEHLTKYIPKISVDLMVGFGSFVDKVASPFVDTNPKKLIQPCDECSAPYGFLHHINMTKDMNIFLSTVRRFQRSGNISPLNGGMDALMQTVACFNPIGWRENSLKYVIFVTDSDPHLEGDGKQANINQLNDQNCHLDSYGYYTYSSLMDYPSVYQINAKAKENKVNIIFAVTKNELQKYKNISQDVEGSAVIELNTESIDHISSIVRNATAERSVVDMKHNSSGEIVSIQLTKREYDEETDVLVSTYRFKLEAIRCNPNAAKTSETIQFYITGVKDSLNVELQIICGCDCHHSRQENSPYCSNSGTLDCGICHCNENHFGRKCECASYLSVSESGCTFPNSTAVCSGRGECTCGRCDCHKRQNPGEAIYGKYCECDNFSCDRTNGRLCSEHGICACGVCLCQVGWTGSSCSCSKGDKNCDVVKTR